VIVNIKDLRKTYKGGFEALKGVTLGIKEGEILALLGPNGAGKTTLISTICGITNPSSGSVTVGGHDVVKDYRPARSMIGLVPQEINLEPFNKVIDVVSYSRGLFGKKSQPGEDRRDPETAVFVGQKRCAGDGIVRWYEATCADCQSAEP
jgi:ABC-2 type transport system ATP-binding protein